MTNTPTQQELRRAERAAWGPRPSAEPAKPRMRLIAWRPLAKNSLHGFSDIELPKRLRILDVAVFVSNGKAWAGLPSRAQIDRGGRQKTDATGKPVYALVLEWQSRELSDRFSDLVVSLIRASHPAEDLDPGRS